ncbi:MAG: hypothetical protein WBW94_08305 [Anaerolineales bacterium]
MDSKNIVLDGLCGLLAFCCLILIFVRLIKRVINNALEAVPRINENLRNGAYRMDSKTTRRLMILIIITWILILPMCAFILILLISLANPSLFSTSMKSIISVLGITIFFASVIAGLILAILFKMGLGKFNK